MLKKLKSLFIVEDESNAKGTVEKKEPEVIQDKSKSGEEPIPSGDISVPVDDGKIDQKFVDVLLKAIDNQNMEGFDYLEYKQSLQSLSKMDMDESTRYKSAFAMAKTMGATKIQRLTQYPEHRNSFQMNFRNSVL